MGSLIHIAALLVSVGITSDNLWLSEMNGNLVCFLKSGKLILLLGILFTLELQVLMYGDLFVKLFNSKFPEISKWISFGLMFVMSLKMIREMQIKKGTNKTTLFDLTNILGIVLASFICVFVLGFSLHSLYVDG